MAEEIGPVLASCKTTRSLKSVLTLATVTGLLYGALGGFAISFTIVVLRKNEDGNLDVISFVNTLAFSVPVGAILVMFLMRWLLRRSHEAFKLNLHENGLRYFLKFVPIEEIKAIRKGHFGFMKLYRDYFLTPVQKMAIALANNDSLKKTLQHNSRLYHFESTSGKNLLVDCSLNGFDQKKVLSLFKELKNLRDEIDVTQILDEF